MIHYVRLHQRQQKYFADYGDLVTFPHTSILYYEGHVPLAGYLIVKGSILLLRRGKIVAEVGPGNLLGASEFNRRQPSPLRAIVTANGQLIILGYSAMKEIHSCPEGVRMLHEIFGEHNWYWNNNKKKDKKEMQNPPNTTNSNEDNHLC
ncbi:MAG: hypothetical protein HQK50_02995 [Oligoflexia bacterium]|nr:hypothetical protein [Oligoflexia bacterium]MBF0364509.1 hypothetical protein [Oligoflexia bacterium]